MVLLTLPFAHHCIRGVGSNPKMGEVMGRGWGYHVDRMGMPIFSGLASTEFRDTHTHIHIYISILYIYMTSNNTYLLVWLFLKMRPII